MLAAQPETPRESDTQFGKYRLIATLGHGGMADVFLAVVQGPAGFNKLHVVKRLRSHLSDEPEFVAMFLDEARLAARLSHPNVVQTYEVGEVGGNYFMAMEYLDGQPLSRIIGRSAKTGGLPLHIGLQVISDALAGLHYAHELADYDGSPLQIVHRDASPHNVFVTYEGQTKVVDFGIAKAATRSAETRTGVLKGKIAYMSPEQARASDTVDRRADIFVCGLLVWELLAGRRMWKGKSEYQVLDHLVQGLLPPIREVRPDVPEVLERICARALALNPNERYATAAEMRVDLIDFLENTGHRRGSEEVSRFVSTLFQDRRAEIKALIEAQLSSLRAGGPTVSLIDIHQHAVNSSSLPQLSPTISSSDLSHPSTASRSQLSQTSTSPVLETPRQTRSVLLVGGISAGLAAVVALLVLTRGAAPEASAPPDPKAAAAQPAAQPTTIDLRVVVSPPNARLFLDDAPLHSNPFSGRFPMDGAGHRVRAEAEGYLPKTTIVLFERNASLDLELEPEPAKTAASAREAPATPKDQSPVPPTGPGKPLKRRLDATDPWAH